MQTTGNQPASGAAPLRYGSESRQRHIIERLTQAILFETLLILALIVFALYQQYKLSKPDNVVVTATADMPPAEPRAAYAPAPGEPNGEVIFDTKCSSCHHFGSNDGTAPGLAGATARVPSRSWLYKWIKDPAAMIKSGDAYALKIYEKYKPTIMSPQNLTDAEIDAVFNYIDAIN